MNDSKALFRVLGFPLGLAALVPALAAPAGTGLLGDGSWALLAPQGAATIKASSGQEVDVTVVKAVKPYYQVQLTHDVAAAVPAGAALHYQFMARSATKNPVDVVVEKRTAPYTRLLDQTVTLTPAWKAYSFTAKAPTAFGKRGLAARLQVGQKAGTLDFKGLTLTRG